jgi:hypothetical protein
VSHHARRLVLLLGVLASLSLCGCAPRISLPSTGPSPAVASWQITDWLALVSGLAAIGTFVFFALIREYAAAISSAIGCVGLAAAFLVLPTVITATKWAVVGCLAISVLGVGYLVLRLARHPDAPLPGFLKSLFARGTRERAKSGQ